MQAFKIESFEGSRIVLAQSMAHAVIAIFPLRQVECLAALDGVADFIVSDHREETAIVVRVAAVEV